MNQRFDPGRLLATARENPLRFGWVVPGVLAGCRRPDAREDYELLSGQGVTTLVSLLEVHALPPFAEDFPLRHAHFPIDDGRPPTEAQLEGFVQLVRASPGVCVHCYAGIGRTGCMLVGYLVRAAGMEPSDAMREVERSRVYAFQTYEQENWLYMLEPRRL